MNRLICLVVVAMLHASGLMAQRAPQELNEAIRRQDSETVGYILQQDIGFEAPRGEHYPPLHVAADLGNLDIIIQLVHAGAAVNQRGGGTFDGALHQAVQRGHFYAAELLLRCSADVDLQDRFGLTALHVAVEQRDVALVNLLLENGANADIRDNSGVTALHLAVQRKHYEVLRALLNDGVNYRVRNARGNTPLHEAVLLRDRVMIGLLLRAGAEPSDQNAQGDSVLRLAFLNNAFRVLDQVYGTALRSRAMAAHIDAGTVLHPVNGQIDCDCVVTRSDTHSKRGYEASGLQNTPPCKRSRVHEKM